MAEKGIKVSDASTGEVVACRDAVETDESSNARIVQLVDHSSRKNSISLASPLRSAIGASDSFTLSPIPTAIIDNAITIGDARSICVAVTYESNGMGGVFITPVVIEQSSNVVIGLLETKHFAEVSEDPTDGYASSFSLGSGVSPTVMQSWPVLGAYRIGFHVWTPSSYSSVNLYACTCSDPDTGFSGFTAASIAGQFGFE